MSKANQVSVVGSASVERRISDRWSCGWRAISKWLFLAGTLLFLVRVDVGFAKPTEYVFSLAILFALPEIAASSRMAMIGGVTLTLVGLVVWSVLLGTAWAAFAYGIYFNTPGIRLLLKLLLSALVFAILLIWFKEDRRFYRRTAIMLSVPYFFYAGVFMLPDEMKLMMVDYPDLSRGRFIGLTAGVGGIAFPLVEAFAFSYVMWLEALRKKTHWRYPLLGGLISLVFLELWSGSRIALAATATSAVVGTVLYQRGMRGRVWGAVKAAGLLSLAVGVGFYLAVNWQDSNLVMVGVSRIIGTKPDGLSYWDMMDNALRLITDPEINIRLMTHEYYKELALSNFITGVGVNWFDRLAIQISNEQLPPDSFLDTVIHGGILLVVAMVLLVVKVISNIWQRALSKGARVEFDDLRPYMLGAATALAGNLVFTVTGGFPIYSLRFWIVLAMCLV